MTSSISAKIQDGGQKLEKSKHFRGPIEVVLSTLGGPKFAWNLSISYGFRDKWHFPFGDKIQDGGWISDKAKFLRGPTVVLSANLYTEYFWT